MRRRPKAKRFASFGRRFISSLTDRSGKNETAAKGEKIRKLWPPLHIDIRHLDASNNWLIDQ